MLQKTARQESISTSYNYLPNVSFVEIKEIFIGFHFLGIKGLCQT